MRICIDSCVFIRGLIENDQLLAQLIPMLNPKLQLTIPLIVALEVTQNLFEIRQVQQFYSFFRISEDASIVYEPPPVELLQRYIKLGLREKGDAYIGAFAEWVGVDHLISDNRHFLRELKTDAFEVLDLQTFIHKIEPGLVG